MRELQRAVTRSRLLKRISWVVAILPTAAFAALAPLDPSFGQNGIVTLDVPAHLREANTAYTEVVVASFKTFPDGSSVAVGRGVAVCPPCSQQGERRRYVLINWLTSSGLIDERRGNRGAALLQTGDAAEFWAGQVVNEDASVLLVRERRTGNKSGYGVSRIGIDASVRSQELDTSPFDDGFADLRLFSPSGALFAGYVGGVYTARRFTADGLLDVHFLAQPRVPLGAVLEMKRGGYAWVNDGGDVIERVDERGRPIRTFGNDGLATAPSQQSPFGIGRRSELSEQFGESIVVSYLGSTGPGTVELVGQTRVDREGQVDERFSGTEPIRLIDSQQRLLRQQFIRTADGGFRCFIGARSPDGLELGNDSGELPWCPPGQIFEAANGQIVVSDGVARLARLAVGGAAGESVNVVEYHAPQTDRYFLTAESQELAALDSMGSGWIRTGNTFVTPGADQVGGNLEVFPVCRFWGDPATGGPNTHFFTRDEPECSRLRNERAANKRGLIFENVPFAVRLPNANNSCPDNQVPAVQWRTDAPNLRGLAFRYTWTSQAETEMQAKGWIRQGLAFCVGVS